MALVTAMNMSGRFATNLKVWEVVAISLHLKLP